MKTDKRRLEANIVEERRSFRGFFALRCITNEEPIEYGGGMMADNRTVIAKAYAAFNRRDVDGALAVMSEGVSWSKASEGGRVVGKEEIRAYWARQWGEFDPHVEPMEVIDGRDGRTEVRVHQIVKSLQGDVLSDSEVWHVHTISDGLIERMDLKESDEGADSGPSAAFSKH